MEVTVKAATNVPDQAYAEAPDEGNHRVEAKLGLKGLKGLKIPLANSVRGPRRRRRVVFGHELGVAATSGEAPLAPGAAGSRWLRRARGAFTNSIIKEFKGFKEFEEFKRVGSPREAVLRPGR